MYPSRPLYLTPPEPEGGLPETNLLFPSAVTPLPRHTLDAVSAPDALPATLHYTPADDTPGDGDAMRVRLTSEEPKIPSGSLIEATNALPNDDEIYLPSAQLRWDEAGMPRLG